MIATKKTVLEKNIFTFKGLRNKDTPKNCSLGPQKTRICSGQGMERDAPPST